MAGPLVDLACWLLGMDFVLTHDHLPCLLCQISSVASDFLSSIHCRFLFKQILWLCLPTVFYASFWLLLFFEPKDGGDISLRNFG
jgi:hypothetical protein